MLFLLTSVKLPNVKSRSGRWFFKIVEAATHVLLSHEDDDERLKRVPLERVASALIGCEQGSQRVQLRGCYKKDKR
jgi:hypothetical protein